VSESNPATDTSCCREGAPESSGKIKHVEGARSHFATRGEVPSDEELPITLTPYRRGSGGRRAVKTHGNSLCDTTAFSGSSLVQFTVFYNKQNLQNVFQPLAACLVVRGTVFKNLSHDRERRSRFSQSFDVSFRLFQKQTFTTTVDTNGAFGVNESPTLPAVDVVQGRVDQALGQFDFLTITEAPNQSVNFERVRVP
jgi:hypothetical protein